MEMDSQDQDEIIQIINKIEHDMKIKRIAQRETAYKINIIDLNIKNNLLMKHIVTLSNHFNGNTIHNLHEYKMLLKESKMISKKRKRSLKIEALEFIQSPFDIKDDEIIKIIKKNYLFDIDKIKLRELYTFEMRRLDNKKYGKYDYYKNVRLIDGIVDVINTFQPPRMERLDHVKNYVRAVSRVIKSYVNHSRFLGIVNQPIKEIEKKIHRLENAIKDNDLNKLKRLCHFRSERNHILSSAQSEVKYLKYKIRKMKEWKTRRIQDKKRIEMNRKRFHTGKRNKEKEKQSHHYPSAQSTLEFWNSIYGKKPHLNEDVDIIKEILNNKKINRKEERISLEDLELAMKTTSNWKTPGRDGIHNYYYKRLLHVRNPLVSIYNNWLLSPYEVNSEEFVGKTVLIFKKGDPTKSENYRPITLLNTSTKLYTKILKNKIEEQLNKNDVSLQMSPDQLGIKKGSLAAKEGLFKSQLISSSMSKDHHYIAFYDLRKAFDSCSKPWIWAVLQYYQVPETIIEAIAAIMMNWEIELEYEDHISIGSVKLQRGILQGDSLSPLLFTLQINPLTTYLYQHVKSESNGKIMFKQTLYVDDIILFAKKKRDMEIAHRYLTLFIEGIGLELNHEKCGLCLGSGATAPDNMKKIPVVTEDNCYKYLGVHMASKVEHKKNVEEILISCGRKLDAIKQLELSSFNMIRTINSDVIGKMKYGCEVINWSIESLEKLNKMVRNTLRSARLIPHSFNKARLYSPVDQLGLGVLDARTECGKEILRSLLKYKWEGDQFIQRVMRGQQMENRMMKKIGLYLKGRVDMDELKNIIMIEDLGKRRINVVIKKVNKSIVDSRLLEWKSLEHTGRFRTYYENIWVDREIVKDMWRKTNIKLSSFSQVLSNQNNMAFTGNFRAMITGKEGDERCTLCGTTASINHVLLNCPLTKRFQIKKHDFVVNSIWTAILKHEGIKTKPEEDFIETTTVVLIKNKEVCPRTEHIPNRPDIFYRRKNDNAIFIIDPTIVADKNLPTAYTNKIAKYQKLQQFLLKNEKVNMVKIIPIVITVNGLLHSQSRLQLTNIGIKVHWQRIIRTIMIESACQMRNHIVNRFLPFRDPCYEDYVDHNITEDGTDDSHSLSMSE